MKSRKKEEKGEFSKRQGKMRRKTEAGSKTRQRRMLNGVSDACRCSDLVAQD